MKKSALAAGLKAAAVKKSQPPAPAPVKNGGRVLIGGHFDPVVRRALRLIQADTGKPLLDLLGEAINDLCAKYGKPEPYSESD